MEKYDILIKNCQVLNPDMTVSSTCSVGIKDSWIKKIGPTDELMADSSASEIIDGKGKLVMPGMVDGHTHTCQQLLRGRVADEYPMVSEEAILARKPEVILIPDMESETIDSLGKRNGWKMIPAVQDKKIYFVDSNICSRPGPRITQAVLILAKAIHPEIDFSDIQ